jgi:hypothetical protein
LNTVYGRYISTTGIPTGNKFPISLSTTFERQHPSLAAGTDNYLVAWNEYHADFDVYGNLDVSVGIENINKELPVQGSTMFARQLAKYLAGNKRIYDILGRKVYNAPISPGIYFLEIEDNTLLKIIVVR